MRRALVLICDDHPLMSQGLRALLKPAYLAVGVVNDGREVLSEIERTKPDILLLDLSMPHRNGLELLPEIASAYPDLKVLVVTMHVDRALADLSMQKGAHGFIPKEASAEELNGAIELVLSGKTFISPRVPRRSFRDSTALQHPALDRLTPRHLQILRLIGDGKSTSDMAEILGVSPRTIEFHRASIRKALGITTEWGLMRFAIMLPPEGEGSDVRLEGDAAVDESPEEGEDEVDRPGAPSNREPGRQELSGPA
ncbi:MAG: response regulator transcription factor [Gemmatimonadota bacterium]